MKEQRAELALAPTTTDEQFSEIETRHTEHETLARELNGDPVREKLSEAKPASIKGIIARVADYLWETTQAPTRAQRDGLDAASARFEEWHERFLAARTQASE